MEQGSIRRQGFFGQRREGPGGGPKLGKAPGSDPEHAANWKVHRVLDRSVELLALSGCELQGLKTVSGWGLIGCPPCAVRIVGIHKSERRVVFKSSHNVVQGGFSREANQMVEQEVSPTVTDLPRQMLTTLGVKMAIEITGLIHFAA